MLLTLLKYIIKNIMLIETISECSMLLSLLKIANSKYIHYTEWSIYKLRIKYAIYNFFIIIL